jgi:hypothetical protein
MPPPLLIFSLRHAAAAAADADAFIFLFVFAACRFIFAAADAYAAAIDERWLIFSRLMPLRCHAPFSPPPPLPPFDGR